MKKNICVESLMKRLIKLQKKIEEVKPVYEEIDQITMHIAKAKKSGDVVYSNDRVEYRLQDNFSNKNTAFRVAAVKRFEIVEKKKAS